MSCELDRVKRYYGRDTTRREVKGKTREKNRKTKYKNEKKKKEGKQVFVFKKNTSAVKITGTFFLLPFNKVVLSQPLCFYRPSLSHLQ